MLRIIGLSILILFCWIETGRSQSVVSYNRDIRPLLSNNCFFCHGFDENQRQAGLRLDRFDDAVNRGAIVPGDVESELIRRILSDDPDEIMPPADSAYALTDQQKEKIKRWVDQGAEYQEHWAFRPLVRPDVPKTNSDSRQAIDQFLQRVWDEQSVIAVDRADARTLVRRLSYDLRGIPPTVAEIERFDKAPSPAAWQTLVEEWTDSMEYAEHQALLWLDLVRWADSTGMVSDEPVDTGLYRSYVIQAFRDNMPFDQFTREQLAGDLLTDANDRTMIASGYNRLVKTNCEAGVIEDEALHALKGEHVRAIGTVWLGVTTGCAECHDHKYDPLSARDYYSLAAFFDDLIEVGVYDPGDRRVPLYYVYDDETSRRSDDALTEQIEYLRKQLYEAVVDADEVRAWEKTIKKRLDDQPETADFAWMPAVLPAARVARGSYQQFEVGRLVEAETNSLVSHMAAEVMTGFMDGGILPASKDRLVYSNVSIDAENPPSAIGLQLIHGAYQRVGWHDDYFTTYFWGDANRSEAMQTTLLNPDAKRVVYMGPIPVQNQNNLVRLEIPGDKIVSSPYQPVGMAWIQIGGNVTWGESGYRLTGKSALTAELAESTLRYWWELPWNRDDREHRMRLVVDSIEKPTQERRPVHEEIIRYAYLEDSNPQLVAELRAAYQSLYQLRQTANEMGLVSKIGPQRETRLRNRGNFMDQTGPIVAPAIPEFLGTLKLDRRANRLDLAHWLTSPDNPLTARVFVNRLWHQFFGRGLSETLEDSGNQGDWPSHPELLDWLAVEFIESGWDVRHMVRLIVSSEAYQMSSIAPVELFQKDPSNRLQARQSRHRLTAEEIRDSALMAAGLLKFTEKIPTHSFYPYQPDSYWEKSNKIMFGSRYQVWDTNQGASQYQRSLYTFWKRQNPHPLMLAFDAPTRQECIAKRDITNTPGQALALLNDPTFVEAARVLAERILSDPDCKSDEQRLRMLFRLAIQRMPDANEQAELSALLTNWISHFESNPNDADAILAIGQSPADDAVPPAKLAAWTAICRVVLNLHEFITRS